MTQNGELRDVLSEEEELTGGHQNALHISHKFNFAYISNQKVGSRSFASAFNQIEKQYGVGHEKIQLKYSGSGKSVDISEKLNGKILFTFVRRPLATAYSAYKEVSHRASVLGRSLPV